MYPSYYFTRRLILAAVCVYLNTNYAGQWLVWTILSLAALFILAKIRPFWDKWMNIVQFINESFIFLALVFMMPLCNNLTDLTARNRVGWCLYAIVLICIIFNILILLIRSCSILCEYLNSRSNLAK